MRLIRLTQQPPGVADDLRGALISIGRGATVVGGVALLGIPAPNSGQHVDAVVIMPRGVLIVVGVNLPETAIRLVAPLGDKWTADGWELVSQDTMTNPAVEALELSDAVSERLRQCASTAERTEATAATGMSIGTVVAVGPYVETVEQPPEELAGTVRVLHPTKRSMLAAAVSLARAPEPLRAAQVREFITALDPSAEPPGDDVLSAEGFVADGATPSSAPEHLATVEPTVPAPAPASGPTAAPAVAPSTPPVSPSAVNGQQATDPGMRPVAPPAVDPGSASPGRAATPPIGSSRRRSTRWIPFGALALLGFLLVAAIIIAITSSGRAEVTAPPSAAPTTSVPPPTRVGGIAFTPRASASTRDCAAHAFGQIRVKLIETGCLRLRRGSFSASVHGRMAATTIAVLHFASEEQARAFKALADTPGTGGIHDLAKRSGAWPGPRPGFARAAYASSLDGASVRLVRTDWIEGRSESSDPTLARIAEAALRLPLPA